MAILVLTAGWPGTGLGQSPTSIIAGTVIDREQRPVAGTKIRIQDSSGKVLSEVVSDAEGHYCLENLPPGQYEITMEPSDPKLQGETVIVNAGAQGLYVDWVASTTAKAIGLARVAEAVTCLPSGSVPAPAPAVIFGGVVVSGWLGSVIGAISQNQVTSGSQ